MDMSISNHYSQVDEDDSPLLLQSSGDLWKMESGASQPITDSQSSFSTHSQGKDNTPLPPSVLPL
jgi:hypothetical protein